MTAIDANRLPDPTHINPGNVPPSDLDAEGAILAWVILEPGDYDRCVAIGLEASHFYAAPNRQIWEAICNLSESKQYIDLVEVAGDLRLRGLLEQVGSSYLARLTDLGPVEGKPGLLEQYCRTVIQHWRARQVIALSQTTIAALYHPKGVPSRDVIEEHETRVWEVAHDEREATYELAGAIGGRGLAELAHAFRTGQTIGATTGYADLDKMTGGYQPGHLVTLAARTGQGKTALAGSSLLRTTKPPADGSLPDAVYFHSLEMPKEEISLRLVCVQASIEYARLRQNQLTEMQWRELFRAADELLKHPILIGDKAALTVTELRSIIRKIKRDITRGTIKAKKLVLAAVDYMQLMTGEQGGGRELEISSITRGLKQLAKSEGLCILGLSQVNREKEKGSSSATDRRPSLANLRECLAGDQWVYDARTGARVQIRDLKEGTIVSALGDDWKLHPAVSASAWSTGKKKIFKLTTGTGRTLRAAGEHRVRVLEGWKTLADLEPHERIAVPRVVPEPTEPSRRFTPDELALLGYLISDGTYTRYRSVGYVKADPALVNNVRRIALSRFGITAKDHKCQGDSEQIELTVTRGRGRRGQNPVILWLKELGIHDQNGPEKTIPEEVLRMDNNALGHFLGALWAGDGSVVKRKRSGWALKFTSTSFQLLDQVMWILTRLGIVAGHGPAEFNTKSKVPIATITIHDQLMIRRFAERVPMLGIKGEKLRRAAIEPMVREKPGFDRLPLAVNELIRAEKTRQGHTYRSLGWVHQGKHISRPNLAKVAATLGSTSLRELAESDVLWDQVESVVPDGEEETFDLSVPGAENFVAQNMCLHNSGAIENDSDAVWFIYREKYYNKDADDQAEIIVAKQRGGATGTVKLIFDGPTISFRPIARGYEEFDDVADNVPEDSYWDR